MDLTKIEDVKKFMALSTSVKNWNAAIQVVKAENQGRIPSWWNKEIIESGLMDGVMESIGYEKTRGIHDEQESQTDLREGDNNLKTGGMTEGDIQMINMQEGQEAGEYPQENTFLTTQGDRVYLPNNVVQKYDLEPGQTLNAKIMSKILSGKMNL